MENANESYGMSWKSHGNWWIHQSGDHVLPHSQKIATKTLIGWQALLLLMHSTFYHKYCHVKLPYFHVLVSGNTYDVTTIFCQLLTILKGKHMVSDCHNVTCYANLLQTFFHSWFHLSWKWENWILLELLPLQPSQNERAAHPELDAAWLSWRASGKYWTVSTEFLCYISWLSHS